MGKKEKTGCDACVTSLRGRLVLLHDRWDSICVSEVGSVCGESCSP